MAETDAEFPTVIGTDAVFKGTLQFEKGVRLLGKFEEGEIATKAKLHVAEGASLAGHVDAAEVLIEGRADATVTASGKVWLKSTARVTGAVQATQLVVDRGASFSGTCEVGPAGRDSSASDQAAAKKPKGKPGETESSAAKPEKP